MRVVAFVYLDQFAMYVPRYMIRDLDSTRSLVICSSEPKIAYRTVTLCSATMLSFNMLSAEWCQYASCILRATTGFKGVAVDFQTGWGKPKNCTAFTRTVLFWQYLYRGYALTCRPLSWLCPFSPALNRQWFCPNLLFRSLSFTPAPPCPSSPAP